MKAHAEQPVVKIGFGIKRMHFEQQAFAVNGRAFSEIGYPLEMCFFNLARVGSIAGDCGHCEYAPDSRAEVFETDVCGRVPELSCQLLRLSEGGDASFDFAAPSGNVRLGRNRVSEARVRPSRPSPTACPVARVRACRYPN